MCIENNKETNSLLDIANELFKNSRSMTKEEQLAVDDYFRKKSKTFYVDTTKSTDKEKLIREVKESMKKR